MPARGWKKAPDGTWAPPNQMRHTLEIEEDTQEWLEEMMDKYLQGKAIRAAGEAAEGFLSNPASALWVGGGLLAGLAALVGADKYADLVDYFTAFESVIAPGTSEEEKSKAANTMIITLKKLLPFGFLVPTP